MAQKQTALQAAIGGGGEKLSDKQAKGALSQAVSRIANLTKKADASKEAVMATGTRVLHVAETEGSLFLSSMAEGYFGPDKLKLGGVDLRAPVGLLAQGYGLYETLSGRGGGDHSLAIGNGVLGSWLASVGVNAGKALAEKRGHAPLPPVQGPIQAPAMHGPLVQYPALEGPGQHAYPRVNLIPDPTLSGPVREVLLTPEVRGEEFEGRRRRGGLRRAAANRFPRAQASDDGADGSEE